MIKVVTTNMSQKLQVRIKEFGHIMPAGIEFSVSNSRYQILSGYNKYHAVFVTKKIENNKTEEQIKEEPKIEKVIPEKQSKRRTKKVAA